VVTPKNAIVIKYLVCRLIIAQLSINFLIAKGARIIPARVHLQNTRAMGGIDEDIPLLNTKFPDQKSALNANKRYGIFTSNWYN